MKTATLSLLAASTLAFILVIALRAQEAEDQHKQGVLSLPLVPADIVHNHAPLTRALGELGASIQHGFVLFGVELRSKDGQEPNVTLDLPPSSRLDDGLRQIMGQIPEYEYQIVSKHMINIYPVGAKNNPQDVLNITVLEFHEIGIDPAQILTSPGDFIPELADRLRSRTSAAGIPQPGGYGGVRMRAANVPTVTLNLKNATVRQILNAASEAMEQYPPDHEPVGWTYLFEPEPGLPGGGKHSWSFLFSASRNWKQDPAGGR
jgi:hypothetical protein